MRRTRCKSALILFFFSQIVSYIWIMYVEAETFNLTLLKENITYADIHMSPGYVSALERATEICPQQRICGGLVDDYAEDPILLQLYLDAMDRQEQKSSDNNSCCYPCSCAEDCIVWQTCCPDTFSLISYPNTTTPPSYNLQCHAGFTARSTQGRVLVEQNKISVKRYSMVMNCLWSVDSKMKLQCAFNILNPKTFIDQVVMEDVHSRHPIHNRYCALCNNMTDVQR